MPHQDYHDLLSIESKKKKNGNLTAWVAIIRQEIKWGPY
jgi:hypothetical protein